MQHFESLVHNQLFQNPAANCKYANNINDHIIQKTFTLASARLIPIYIRSIWKLRFIYLARASILTSRYDTKHTLKG